MAPVYCSTNEQAIYENDYSNSGLSNQSLTMGRLLFDVFQDGFTAQESPFAFLCSSTYLEACYPTKPFNEQELSDQELMQLPFKAGMFSFLDNKDEDIYTIKDGRPLR